jgi:hypothetical protein
MKKHYGMTVENYTKLPVPGFFPVWREYLRIVKRDPNGAAWGFVAGVSAANPAMGSRLRAQAAAHEWRKEDLRRCREHFIKLKARLREAQSY